MGLTKENYAGIAKVINKLLISVKNAGDEETYEVVMDFTEDLFHGLSVLFKNENPKYSEDHFYDECFKSLSR